MHCVSRIVHVLALLLATCAIVTSSSSSHERACSVSIDVVAAADEGTSTADDVATSFSHTALSLVRCRGGGLSSSSYSLSSQPNRSGTNNATSVLASMRSAVAVPKRSRSLAGGLLAFLRRRTTSSVDELYRKALEEQVQIMERQIRAARDEASHLRTLIKEKGVSTRKEASDTVRKGLETARELREEVSRLMGRIRDLEEMRDELMSLLEIEKKRVEEQSKLLDLERKKMSETEKKSKEEMEKLRTALMEQTKKQLEELERSAEKRVEKERRRVQDEADERIKAERLRGEEAVEQEKIKMRKLVKALAEKEQKALPSKAEAKKSKKKQQQQRQEEEEGKSSLSKTIISGNSRSGTPSAKAKATGATVRGSAAK